MRIHTSLTFATQVLPITQSHIMTTQITPTDRGLARLLTDAVTSLTGLQSPVVPLVSDLLSAHPGPFNPPKSAVPKALSDSGFERFTRTVPSVIASSGTAATAVTGQGVIIPDAFWSAKSGYGTITVQPPEAQSVNASHPHPHSESDSDSNSSPTEDEWYPPAVLSFVATDDGAGGSSVGVRDEYGLLHIWDPRDGVENHPEDKLYIVKNGPTLTVEVSYSSTSRTGDPVNSTAAMRPWPAKTAIRVGRLGSEQGGTMFVESTGDGVSPL